jgi:diguanylate cyclase (GGDEF)-like protein
MEQMLTARARIAPVMLLAALLTAAILAALLHVVFGVGGWSFESALRGAVPAAAMPIAALILLWRVIAVADDRERWLLPAAAVCSYGLAFLLWGTWLEPMPSPPDPSPADFLWSAFYPLSALGICVAGWGRARTRAVTGLWLDGLIAAIITAAIGAAFVMPPILHNASGKHAAVVTELIYPMADLVLIVLMVGSLGARGWRIDRTWTLATLGFALLTGADCIAAVDIAHGSTAGHSPAVLLYMLAFATFALAAWSPRRPARTARLPHWMALILPAGFTLAAPAILIYDHFHRVPLAAIILTILALIAGGVRLAVAMRDILALREARQLALTDELTGLANRRRLFQDLHAAIARCDRDGDAVTVMMLDIDNFKQLNDTLGHHAGDELLRLVGPCLKAVVPTGATTARFGGDEFALLLPASTPADEIDIAGRALAALRSPLCVQGVTLRLTASLGIAAFPRDADGAEELVRHADVAMYSAKQSRDGWARYEPLRDPYTPERLALAHELADALERGQIDAHFQPIAEADSGAPVTVGAEALARWLHRDGRMRSPADFIAAAERSGLSRALTRRMLELALDALCTWRAQGYGALYVSVNVTVADLVDETFPAEVADLLRARRLTGAALVLEVTESSIVADPEHIGATLQRLRVQGVQIALDDFGTGYSSLTHLRDLPVDQVKIDRTFVMGMSNDPTDAAIVFATVELAHRLGFRVVAEGVEDEATWDALRALGCERIQGYWLSKPVPAADFLEAAHLAESQSSPDPASTASGGSIA